MYKLIFVLVLVMNLCSCVGNKQQSDGEKTADQPLYLLVGSYSTPTDEGIKLYTFNQQNGDFTYLSGIRGISNPSYLTPSSDGRYVYAVSENDEKTAAANVFSLDLDSAKLTFLDSKLTKGAAPCYIALSPREDFVVTANYNGGSISIFSCEDKGTLSEPQVVSFEGHGRDPERQEQPHLHCIGFAPNEQHLFGIDLGLDCIHVLPIKPFERQACSIVETHEEPAQKVFVMEDQRYDVKVPAGAGPRHYCFSRDQRFLYLITELSGDVFVMDYLDGHPQMIQQIKADTLGARGSADIHLTPDGKFLYASNRLKGDGIAIFKVDSLTGKLAKIGYQPTGIHPRNFVITPNGKYLLVACRDTNEIQVFEIDQATGLLRQTNQTIHTSQPTCLKFINKR